MKDGSLVEAHFGKASLKSWRLEEDMLGCILPALHKDIECLNYFNKTCWLGCSSYEIKKEQQMLFL